MFGPETLQIVGLVLAFVSGVLAFLAVRPAIKELRKRQLDKKP